MTGPFIKCATLVLTALPALAATCESLAKLSLPDTTITLAVPVASGAFTPRNPPAFCRVAATLKPTPDSDIKIEVWLPESGWNGKYQAVGNGGWLGSIMYGSIGPELKGGYATSSTDTGHEGGTASFALGHPEKLIDYAYRSEHEMTVAAKAIIAAFYGKSPRLSYWNGCSAGRKQALNEAQRYPQDFDGIVAGPRRVTGLVVRRSPSGSLNWSTKTKRVTLLPLSLPPFTEPCWPRATLSTEWKTAYSKTPGVVISIRKSWNAKAQVVRSV